MSKKRKIQEQILLPWLSLGSPKSCIKMTTPSSDQLNQFKNLLGRSIIASNLGLHYVLIVNFPPELRLGRKTQFEVKSGYCVLVETVRRKTSLNIFKGHSLFDFNNMTTLYLFSKDITIIDLDKK